MAYYDFKDFYILKTGEVIPLFAYLWDGRSDLYVTATILDAQNTVIYNKILLSYASNGKYQYSSPTVVFPSGNNYIQIIYEVYTDFALTQLSTVHSKKFMIIQNNDIVSDTTTALSDIQEILSDMKNADIEIEFVEDQEIEMDIEEEDEIEILIELV